MRDLVDELLQAQVKARLVAGDHAPRLGRLVILDKLGAGAMGTVFSAYDPRLDRKVAVKIMHATDADARTRVLREARALARLAHPNIVTIHDAGEDDGTVHVVMELATGVPLRVWIDNPDRTWRDVVRVMSDVAAGLAAAHEANIIHRDIKPENILVGADRARLVDFGLALDPEGPPPETVFAARKAVVLQRPRVSDPTVNTVDLSSSEPERVSDAFLATIDLTGTKPSPGPATDPDAPRDTDPLAATSLASLGDHAAGTPSYMAPEVLAGGLATAASDQFSFAVTLFEALHGERSHTGTTREELHAAALRASAPSSRSKRPSFPEEGVRAPDLRRGTAPEDTVLSVAELRPTKRRARSVGAVPTWVEAIVRRALAAKPEERFGSMAVLHAELVRDRTRRRRAIAIAAAALVIGGGIGVLAYRARGGNEHTVADRVSCDAKPRVDEVWSSLSQTRIRDALGDAPWASSTIAGLERTAAAWQASFQVVCEATRVRGEQSDRLLELRMRCLDRTLDRFDAFSEALQTQLDGSARIEAASAVVQLPQPADCETLLDDPELAVPADPARRTEAAAVERELDHAWAAYALGRYTAARTQATALSQRVAKLDLPALHASVLLLGGAVEARIGEGKRARSLFEAAVVLAAKAKATELELEIVTRLFRQELFQGHRDRVIEWGSVGEAAAIHAGHEGAEVSAIIGEALREAGKLEEARARLTAALASRDRLREDARAMIEMNLASVDLALGRAEIARVAYQRAHDRTRTALGDGHPTLAIHIDR
ncbi:MAG: serine/threonine protein kinase, partial [Deltaproteobacteria bacterium]|nr:serine/threonine protein kinase [Deltaproteobacteria bacterium]